MSSKLLRSFEEHSTLVLSFLINLTRYRQKHPVPAEINRIVVIKLDHIGDVILSIPALSCLRANFPKSHITMVVNSSTKSITSLIPYIDRILCYNANFFNRTGHSRRFDFHRGLRFARDMRNGRFDLIVDLRGSFASLFYAMLGNAKYRLDRGTYLVQRKFAKRSAYALAEEHEAEVNLDILKRAGIKTDWGVKLSRQLLLNIPKNAIEKADSLLKNNYPYSYSIAMHPGGPTQLKRWAPEMYAKLIEQLIKDYNARVILVGGKSEQEITKAISALTNEEVLDISGQITLEELTAILQKVDLFIGNDSGPMHIAAACGTKVIGLFGPTSPQRFGPYGDSCVALRMERDCSPCMRDKCKKPGYRCVDRISLEDVMEAVRLLT